MSRNRRTWNNLFAIESDFKRRQLLRVFGFAGAYVVLSTLVLGFFYVHVLHPGLVGSRPFYLDLSNSGEMWRQIPGLRRTVMLWATYMTGLSALFAAAVGLHLSHKMAGPIYRFKQELSRLGDGAEVRRIELRKGDDFQDVASALNGALETLERRRKAVVAQVESAEEADLLRDVHRCLRETLDHFDAQGLCQADAERVQALLSRLREQLAKGEGA